MRHLNSVICEKTSGYLIAEESSPEWGITEDVKNNGLGFKLKWNMGWMTDTLNYIKLDPVYRQIGRAHV